MKGFAISFSMENPKKQVWRLRMCRILHQGQVQKRTAAYTDKRTGF